jgi:RNA polymerase sigma factor (sigma-70 family)
MDDWVVELRRGRLEAAWDLFLDRYRRLVFAAIRHYADDPDDVMDVFARVCDALRENDMRKLRMYVDEPNHRARFSTWLVAVVRHLTVDWFRERDGRPRLSALAQRLPPLQRRIFELVFLDRQSHGEAYEIIRARDAPTLSFRAFLAELRATYRSVTAGRRGHLFRELGTPAPEHLETASAEDAGELRDVLDGALSSLDEEDRATLELYVVEELPAADVARIVGLPNVKAVYNRVYRALTTLRSRLQRAGIGPEDL